MQRLRKLGLAAVLSLAVTAAAGGATAQAAQFHGEKSPALIHAAVDGTLSLITQSALMKCEGGFATEIGAPTEVISSVSQISCSGALNVTITVDMNGCHLIFHAGSETEPGESTGSFDIGPPGCDPIVASFNWPGHYSCTITYPSQAGVGSATYETVGSGSERHLSISASSNNLDYTESGECGSRSRSNGTLYGTWLADAKNEGGQPLGLFIDTTAVEPHAPLFEAVAYPTAIESIGGGQGTHQFAVKAGSIDCAEASFSAELGEAGAELALNAEYSDCNATILGSKKSVNVEMNSCHYAVELSNAGPPYEGTTTIVCDEPGDAIVATITGLEQPCVVEIGAQEGTGSVDLTSDGGTITADSQTSGLHYTQTGIFCPGNSYQQEKSFTTGSSTDTANLVAAGSGYVSITGEQQ